MNLELVISEKVHERKIHNAFVLRVVYMHGDADMMSSEEYTFLETEKQDLVRELVILETAMQETNYSGDKLEELGFMDAYGACLPTDVTCPGCYACPHSYTLTYYDEQGEAYNVVVNKIINN